MIRTALLALVVLSCPATALASAERYAVVISGASGSADHATQHADWRDALTATLLKRMQMPADHILALADIAAERTAGRTPPEAVLTATRDNVRQVFTRLARTLGKDDVVLVVLFGHSTYDGVDAKFNLVGPDLEAADWKSLLAPIPARLVFVNTTGASAPFLQRLADERRIIVTATDNAAQKYETVFPRFFVDALEQTDSDLDKDGRVSVWEAFAWASANVKTFYRQRGQLAVERPVLDDTGDGTGKEAGAIGPDGSLASRTFLDAEDDPSRAGGPALSELISRRNALESQFEDLKRRRSFIPAIDYEKQRDALLIEIARVSRQIRLEQQKRS